MGEEEERESVMGYGYYLLPSGKEAGYGVSATCEHPGCSAEIDRGMSYACGGEAGDQGGCSCEGYFCTKHLHAVTPISGTHARTELGSWPDLCPQCVSRAAFLDEIEEAEEYRADPQFAPNPETMKILVSEGCQYLPTEESAA